MSNIKLTKKEIEKIVKEANRFLLENRVSVASDPDAFPTGAYPYYGNEVVAAQKQKIQTYEKYVNTCLQSLKMMVDQVNADYTGKNISDLEVKFL